MIRLAKTIKYSICGGVAFIALAGASPAQAVSFLSTFRSDTVTPTQVGTIDATTGAFTVTNTNGLQLTDIALNTSDELFGITFDQLYRINGSNPPSSAKNLGVTGMNGLGFTNTDALYGIGSGGFYSIDTSSGLASLLSNPAGFSSAGDLLFNPLTGKFLATSNTPGNSTLFTIDLMGNATAIGAIGFSNVFGLTFDGGNLLGYTSDRKQIKINLSTGAGIFDKDLTGTTLVIGGAASSLTSLPATTAIPEPSFIPGFVVLGACLGVRSLANRKKSQKSIE
jgi:hypothetical protein